MGHKFREHYELMNHQRDRIEKLVELIIAVLCMAIPSAAVEAFVARVVYNSIPPSDPHCGLSRRYCGAEYSYNHTYELIVNGHIAR